MDDLTGVARGAETLLDVLSEFSGRGWPGQFAVRDDAMVECETCHHEAPAADVTVLALRRLEGASDPDDMLAVVAIECPRCQHRGSLVLQFGPTATAEDAAVLEKLATLLPTMSLVDPDEDSGATPRIKNVQLTGDIDVVTAGEVGDWLCGLVTADYDEVVVTCTQVSFVESRGLAMMARVQRFADEGGCRLRWRELPLHVLRTIHVTGLDTYLHIEA